MGRVSILVVSFAALVLTGSLASAAPKAAIVAVDLAGGAPEFVRAKATAKVQDGLTAAGYEVLPREQVTAKLTGDLASCRSGACLAKVAKLLDVSSLVVVSVTRKDESTIIVIKLLDPQSGEAAAEVHEVCDLCGQDELEDRINVAASALRQKAEAARGGVKVAAAPVAAPAAAGGVVRVAVIPGIAVNLDVARVDALGQDLAESLQAELVVEASGGLEVRRQLPAEGLPADCASTPACVADVAKRTGAVQLLFVVMVGGAGGSVQIDTMFVDVTTGQHVSRPAIDLTSSSDSDAKAKFDTVARQLLPDATVRPKPVGTGHLSIDTKMTEGTPRHFTKPALLMAAVAGVGLVSGVGLGLATRSKYDDCDHSPATCSSGARDTIRHYALGADISFGVAAGAAIATVVLYATSSEAPHVIVTPTPEGASASWIGRF